MLTSRAPSNAESTILATLYRDQREHFEKAPDAAKALVSVGETPRDEKLAAADVAALAIVVRMLMSFDECVSKR
jgi:hypothetical protein